MENKPKTLQGAKNIFEKLKTDSNTVLFSENKIDKPILKKLKNHLMVKQFIAEANKSD